MRCFCETKCILKGESHSRWEFSKRPCTCATSFCRHKERYPACGREATGLAPGQLTVVNWQLTSSPPPSLAPSHMVVKYGENITPYKIGRKSECHQILIHKHSISVHFGLRSKYLICETLRSSKSPRCTWHMERPTVGAPDVLVFLPLLLTRHRTVQAPWLPSF